MIDPTPAPSSLPVIPQVPAGSPQWLTQLMAIVGTVAIASYLVASAIGALWPATRIGKACVRWCGDIRNLAARQPAPEDKPASKEDPKP